MKAIQVREFGGPEVLQLAEVSPLNPGPGQVIVRLRAIGVNPVETYIRSGNYPKKPVLPYTPGTDGAGEIVRLGDEVRGFAVGERVYVAGSLSGTYAEETLCAAVQVHGLPAATSFEQGAGLGIPYATAHFALFTRAQASAGETVLVHGASGGVGLAAVQFAHAAGLTVFGTAGTIEGRALVREHGADDVFDHTAPDYVETLLASTGDRGFNVIAEMLANVNLARDLSLLAPRGRIAVIGSRGSIEIDPRDAMARNADIRGVMLFGATSGELELAHTAIRTGLENGTLRPFVGRSFPLADAAEAHRAVMAPGARGKIVLIP